MTQNIDTIVSNDNRDESKTNVSNFSNTSGFMKVPHIDITVSKTTTLSDLREIYRQLNADKDLNKLILNELVKGYLNCMYKCYQEDQNPDDALIIRLFDFRRDLSQFSEQKKSPQNRQLEFESMCIGSQMGICANIKARFNNGLVYSFVPGQTLQLDQVHDIELGKLVAVQVARMHAMIFPTSHENTHLTTQINQEAIKKYWIKKLEFMQSEIEKSPINEYKSLPNLLEINSWIEELKNRLMKIGMGEMGFCHTDLNLSNIVYNEKTKVVKILDFEWAQIKSHTMIDIATHFASFAGFFLQDFDSKLLPSQEFQLQWIRQYMQELNRLKGREMDDDEFDKICQTLLIKVNIYMQIMKLNYVVRATSCDFFKSVNESTSKNDEKYSNKVVLYSLKALNGYQMDKERTECLLKQLEHEKEFA